MMQNLPILLQLQIQMLLQQFIPPCFYPVAVLRHRPEARLGIHNYQNYKLKAHCIDLDGHGVLTPNEMQFFYEEHKHCMECMGQELVIFEDILRQIVDIIVHEAFQWRRKVRTR